MENWKKGIIILCSLIIIGSGFVQTMYADTPTPTPSPTPTGSPTPTPQDNSQAISDLQNKINDLQNKINDLQGQEKTLASQIAVFDSQITLTQYRIDATKQQILSLEEDIDTTTKKIAQLQSSVQDLTKLLLNRIVATYETGTQNNFQVLLSSNNINDYFKKENYLRLVQEHDRKLVFSTVQAKDDYTNQRQILENKKQQVIALQLQLQQYTDDLNNQKSQKQSLLAQTQGSEENYQRILAQTKAQLASFQGFVSSQGGASLLSNQTVCDDWGCYYNQRDTQWGGNALNGTGYTLAEAGCLITSMSMVYTHYGHRDVNPQSINGNGDNFSGIPAALLKYNISANGIGSSRTRVGSSWLAVGSIDHPVIVGISYDGGPYPDHFLVLISGSNGNYNMNDPFTPNGHDIPFTSKYALSSIVEVDNVNM